MLKNCLEILIAPITDIINIRMETSTFYQNFKEAHVRPLLKKTSLTKNELKNCRPVSDLSFISKILQNVVANRLQTHIKNNHLSNPFINITITFYLIHYNQPAGHIILQSQLQ